MFYLTIPLTHDAVFSLHLPSWLSAHLKSCSTWTDTTPNIPWFQGLLSAQVLDIPGNPSQIPAQAWESYFLRIVFSTVSSILNYFGWEVGKKFPHVLLARFPFKTELFISDRFFQARKTCYISSFRGCFGILYLYDSIKLSVMRMNNSKNYSLHTG